MNEHHRTSTVIDTKTLEDAIPEQDHPLRAHRYTTIIDADNSTFFLRRLNSTNRHKSCYEMKKDKEISEFCYPSLHIAGVAKAGTSALYRFFTSTYKDVGYFVKAKEYCLVHIRERAKYYAYLKGFVDGYKPSGASINVNGCLLETDLILLHNLLRPRAAYLLSIRDLPTREWAAYNFWCDTQLDLYCNAKHDWTGQHMFRSPEMFEQLLRYVNYPNSPGYARALRRCSTYNNVYSNIIAQLENTAKGAVIVVSSEGLLKDSESTNGHPLFQKMLTEVGKVLKIRLPVPGNGGPFSMEVVNTGNNRGTTAYIDGAEKTKKHAGVYVDPLGGKYKVSQHRQMLPSTQQYLKMCWTECSKLSAATMYDYDCSEYKLATGRNATTQYLQQLDGPKLQLETLLHHHASPVVVTAGSTGLPVATTSSSSSSSVVVATEHQPKKDKSASQRTRAKQ
eukprot:CAMPEP_0174981428 /NCGR_PEP_ID=MMETSP0004_2-20121128/15886_1 /TAXON_ID=420556 /ORGANISM="Ochromonas sp., Strain CCMP1393" /LENGTH=449 /DNA_ID=CAMNT_0016233175 /DNA_START=89 /DNA_END=1435 /DNA_ORIENTATION=+